MRDRQGERRRGKLMPTFKGIHCMKTFPILFFPAPIRCKSSRGFDMDVYGKLLAFPDGQLLVYESKAPKA